MFTGIITDVGEILEVTRKGDLKARIATSYDVSRIDIGASIACDGVCLTVVALGTAPRGWFEVDISAETVSKTNIGADGCSALIQAVPDLDVLVNNVGIFEPRPFEEIGDVDWLRFFETNVMSGVRLSRHYLKGMRERDWGRIVFISSESGVQIPPEMIHYGMTKTAQLAIARGIAQPAPGEISRNRLQIPTLLSAACAWTQIRHACVCPGASAGFIPYCPKASANLVDASIGNPSDPAAPPAPHFAISACSMRSATRQGWRSVAATSARDR